MRFRAAVSTRSAVLSMYVVFDRLTTSSGGAPAAPRVRASSSRGAVWRSISPATSITVTVPSVRAPIWSSIAVSLPPRAPHRAPRPLVVVARDQRRLVQCDALVRDRRRDESEQKQEQPLARHHQNRVPHGPCGGGFGQRA